jgi:hypothetical protein
MSWLLYAFISATAAALTAILAKVGVVERTFAWPNQFRLLRVRYDKRTDIHEAFLSRRLRDDCWRSLRTGHDRPVAIKILPEAFAAIPRAARRTGRSVSRGAPAARRPSVRPPTAAA